MDVVSETSADEHTSGNEESTVAGNEVKEMPSISWEAIAASDFQTGSLN